MRILYISAFYFPDIAGGAEITLQTLVEGMRDAGHDVGVLAIGTHAGLQRHDINGVAVWKGRFQNTYFQFRHESAGVWQRLRWHLADRYNLKMQDYVAQVITQFQPDIVSCHNLAGWSVSVWDAIADMGVPIAQVLHDQYLLCPKSTMFKGTRRCVTQCFECKVLRAKHAARSERVGMVVGVSKFILKRVSDHGYFKNAKVRTFIHNARNVSTVDVPDKPRGADSRPTFGFIGALAPNKGIEILLEAFLTVADESWELVIAGSGAGQYEEMVRSRFRDPRIIFLGRRSPSDFFPRIDATVVPSLWDEPLGMVAAESLIFGKPVLASKRGGISEMLDESCGVLFEPTVKEVASSLLEFAASLEMWRGRFSSIQSAGRRYSDSGVWVRQYESAYHRLLYASEASQ